MKRVKIEGQTMENKMKNILTSSLFAFAFSLVASAAPSYWAAVETTAYEGDTSGGTKMSSYSAYYCTVEAANTLFGGTSVSKIESYLQGNFAKVKDMATTYDGVAYSDGEYQILHYVDAPFGSAEYVAVAFYGDEEYQAYRVYGNGSAALTPYGQLAFNESYATAGTVGDWTAASVPEPTSGLLLLLGVAGLALKRKRVDAAACRV